MSPFSLETIQRGSLQLPDTPLLPIAGPTLADSPKLTAPFKELSADPEDDIIEEFIWGYSLSDSDLLDSLGNIEAFGMVDEFRLSQRPPRHDRV